MPAGEDDWPWQLPLDSSPTLLFRFSALTYNAHRIHYTLDEGYADLVVQGPLLAIGLAEVCRRHAPANTMRRFAFQARRPAIGRGPIRLSGRPLDDGRVELAALDRLGQRCMAAEATLTS